MKRLLARLMLLAGAALILVAAMGLFRVAAPPPPPRPAAEFHESLWPEAVPALPAEPVYTPSEPIRQAARSESAGIWPLSHSWVSYAPPGAAAPRHVVVLLHGAGRDGLSMLEMWKDTADRHGLLLVAPNGGALRFSALGRSAVTSAARQAAASYGLPEDRLYLFGHSDGAVLAQALVADAAPGQWQAAALHAGFLPAEDLPAGHSATPVRLYLGDKDHIFALEPARRSLHALAQQGHPAELVTVPGHSHWFYAIGPAIAEESWQWFAALTP